MRKQRGITALLCSLILIGVGTAIHFITLDGLVGSLFSLSGRDDTQYAQGYSASRFRQIKPGMTASNLTDILGTPLVIWSRDVDFRTYDPQKDYAPQSNITYSWRYTISPGDTDYHIRTISVRNGVVVGKQAEYYMD